MILGMCGPEAPRQMLSIEMVWLEKATVAGIRECRRSHRGNWSRVQFGAAAELQDIEIWMAGVNYFFRPAVLIVAGQPSNRRRRAAAGFSGRAIGDREHVDCVPACVDTCGSVIDSPYLSAHRLDSQ
jgi:hypothetical protein